MRIRKFCSEDKKQVSALISKILREIFKVKPKKVMLDRGLFRKDGVLYIAEDKHKIVGTIGIRKQSNRVARLNKMYIEKFYRGSGLSQKLLKKALAFARDKGYRKIILSTTPQMKRAITFYKNNGFVKYRINRHGNQIFFFLLMERLRRIDSKKS
ncbi:GNAT family N-acetyltransferase [Candidatus Pacearchaeota archaeon]|nr:GNAT family N-acetyltransferase [Candidatus Pacearchaeota archaeon]